MVLIENLESSKFLSIYCLGALELNNDIIFIF